MTTTIETHWTDEVDVTDDGMHEPTVRAIIDTMKRTGAGFAAAVLEAQFRTGQVTDEPNKEARRLRQLADFLERHPDVTLGGINGGNTWSPAYVFCSDAEEMTSVRRKIGGRWEKSVDDNYFNLVGMLGDNHVQLCVSRKTVCERVVVGTETKLVPDPEAPKVEREVEIVEWKCPDALLVGTEAAPEPVAVAVADDEDIPF